MSIIDKLKLFWVVLQKGQELGNKEAWKNVAAVTITLQAIFNVIAGILPDEYKAIFSDEAQAILAAALANVGAFVVIMYLHIATSKSVGLPPSGPTDTRVS